MSAKIEKQYDFDDGSVDAGLFLLELVTPYGFERTQGEIAYVCGCTLQNIQHYERQALKKIRAEFERRHVQQLQR